MPDRLVNPAAQLRRHAAHQIWRCEAQVDEVGDGIGASEERGGDCGSWTEPAGPGKREPANGGERFSSGGGRLREGFEVATPLEIEQAGALDELQQGKGRQFLQSAGLRVDYFGDWNGVAHEAHQVDFLPAQRGIVLVDPENDGLR